MTTWIGLVVLAQLINAAIVLVDKYVLLSKDGIGKPTVYAFYVSLLSGVVLVLVPFGVVTWPSALVIWLSVNIALCYIASIILLYSALKVMRASDAVPVVGGVAAIVTLVAAYWGLRQDLPQTFLFAFVLLTVGTLFISHFRFNRESFSYVFMSGLLFGASAFLFKLLFMQTSFMNGFFWSRMANVLGVLILLLVPDIYESIKERFRHAPRGTKWIVIGNKAMGGLAFVLILLAIKLGDVAVVNAMSGLQFVFLLTFAYLFADTFPEIFKGEIHHHRFPHKLFGIIFIALGLVVLFL